MGHYTGTAYTFKLNEEDSSYEDILVSMQEEIDKKHIEEEKNPGESFSAGMSVKNGIVSYSSSGYKSRVSHNLSYELIKKIQKNINTNPDVCYGYTTEEGEAIEGLHGYAKKIGQYFLEADYATGYNGYVGIYNYDSIDLFKKCLHDKSLLEDVIRKGEGVRLKTELFTEKNEINEYNFYQKKTPDSTEYELNEKWLAYWLVYGTDNKYNTDFNYYSNARMNLKEYLFALDYKHYDNHKGVRVLKDLTRYGVLFKEGLDSIEGNFKLGVRYDASGHDISKEKIEAWYQEHKEDFVVVPKISKNLANYLKENYPETFLKLKDILIELHNTPKGMRKMSNIQYWSGDTLEKLEDNEVFVFGSNPQGRHGAGAAKAAMAFGSKYGQGKGFSPNQKTYAIITKNLQAGITVDGIKYDKEGYLSISEEQIKSQIDEMYNLARQPEHQNKRFLITYKYETYPNGTPKKSLNGYTSQEMLEMFVRKDIPENIVFHDSYKQHLEKVLLKLVENQPEEKQKMQLDNKQKEYTFFFHLTSPFSNFHPSKFEYKELTFISNEQFMMYSKAKTFKDEATAQKIIEMNNTPLIKDFIDGKITREEIVNDKVKADQWNKLMMKIKGFGKDVSPYNDEVWSNRRAKVVLFGAREKFSQNEDLKQILMNTGDTYMVEASPYDKIWGIGLSAGDARRIPEEKWPGLNLLGQVLDVLKAEFKAQLVNKGDSLPRKKF